MAGRVSLPLTDIAEAAKHEGVPAEFLAQSVEAGESIIITSRRGIEPLGIGKGLRAKFACIVGSSTQDTDIESVVRKAKIAVRCGASVIHNGSAGGDVREIQKRLLEEVRAPLATCHPIGVMASACYAKRRLLGLKEGEFIQQARADMEQGIEIILLPLGVTKAMVDKLPGFRRVMPCCSKSGSMMASWIAHNGKENPYCLHFNEILDMAKKNKVTLSVVGAFRSGCIQDALDEAQYAELKIIKEYVERAKAAGVQVKAGSGGHMPADKIAAFFNYQKELLKAPIISFGPQVTDISLGYDHVSAAMGQIIALLSGADIIFSITPSEHLAMPGEDETKAGCIAAKIACHSADITRGKDIASDNLLSQAREKMDWAAQQKFAFDEATKEKLRLAGANKKSCSVCGDFCAFELKNLYTHGRK